MLLSGLFLASQYSIANTEDSIISNHLDNDNIIPETNHQADDKRRMSTTTTSDCDFSIYDIDNTTNIFASRTGNLISMSIRSDDLPVIAYYDGGNNAIKIAFCGDTLCQNYNNIIKKKHTIVLLVLPQVELNVLNHWR